MTSLNEIVLKRHVKNKKNSLDKRYIYSLTLKYGIGKSLALFICKKFGIPPFINTNNVNAILKQEVEDWIKVNLKTGRALNLANSQNIQFLVKNKSRRGFRHLWKLPVRGQRSKTNGRTQKRLKIRI